MASHSKQSKLGIHSLYTRSLTAKSCGAGSLATLSVVFSCFLFLLVLSGCDSIPSRPILKPPKDNNKIAEQAEKAAEVVEAPRNRFVENWEAWYVHHLNNNPVGYRHLTASRIVESSVVRSSKENIRYVVDDQVKFRRGNSTLIQHLNQTSSETPEGELLNFESTLRLGPLLTEFTGNVAEEKLTVETVRGSSRVTERTPWQSVYRGLQAVEQSLFRKPMEIGETRNLKMLMPLKHKIAKVKLFCSGMSATGLLDGSYQKLTEIVSEESIDDKPVGEQVLWVNDSGVVLKTLRPGIGLVSYRTDEATALAGVTPINEVLSATLMDVKGVIKRPSDTMQVAFLVGPSLDVQQSKGQVVSIKPAPGQFVRKLEDGTWQVLVTRHNATNLKDFQSLTQPPVEEDTRSNVFIDSNTGSIRSIANTATRKSMSKEEMAIELTKTVNNLILPKELSQGFTKASMVLQASEGGCTESSVLLAALLRNKGIPARLAVGLIYVPAKTEAESPAMAYHMWTVAYVDDQWIPLDAVTGDIAPADRITLMTTNLSGRNEHQSLAPAMAAFGRLQIEVRKATY